MPRTWFLASVLLGACGAVSPRPIVSGVDVVRARTVTRYASEMVISAEGGCSQTHVSSAITGSVRLETDDAGRAEGCYEERTHESYTSGDYMEEQPGTEEYRFERRVALRGTWVREGGELVLALRRVTSLDGCASTAEENGYTDWTLRCVRVEPNAGESPLPSPALACALRQDALPRLFVGGMFTDSRLLLGEAPGIRVIGHAMWQVASEDWYLRFEPLEPR